MTPRPVDAIGFDVPLRVAMAGRAWGFLCRLLPAVIARRSIPFPSFAAQTQQGTSP